MAEMDRHQLGLAYDAVVQALACSRTHTRRLETLAGWTRVWRVAKKLLAGFSLTAGKKL